MTVTPGQTPERLPSADDSLMSTATAPAVVRPTRPRGDAPYAVVGRPRNEGHGKRLTAAFEALEDVRVALAELPEPWSDANVEESLRSVVERTGRKAKQIFQPLRVALTGTTVSPGIFETVALLGRDETLTRLGNALEA